MSCSWRVFAVRAKGKSAIPECFRHVIPECFYRESRSSILRQAQPFDFAQGGELVEPEGERSRAIRTHAAPPQRCSAAFGARSVDSRLKHVRLRPFRRPRKGLSSPETDRVSGRLRRSAASLHAGMTLLLIPFILIFGFTARAETSRLKIAATIFPIADIAKQIAGEEAEVLTILPAGANPHAFELTPRAVKALEGVRAVFVVGHGFDDWIKTISESLPGAALLNVDEGIDLIGDKDKDPHYWLALTSAKTIARTIAERLGELEPAEHDRYQANLDAYLAKLEEGDQVIRNISSHLASRKIMTYHDGWRYFARDYGLEIVGTVESSQGNEPTPKRLAKLTQLVSRHRLKVLFSEPGVSKDVASSLAQDLNLKLHVLDPIGGRDGPTRSYLDLMVVNARVIGEAIGDE
ncbi:MAG: zinc ABC transporter substrate-binding protein [Candidatus Omnitrophica bacterium]|nr:zinc ABC transporter substrate-binding protein [Candidatus Omnitrophota bacterium]